MIHARHTLAGKLVSELYAGPMLDRSFREVRFIGTHSDQQKPILMLSNHFSWWDGFIQYRLNRVHFGRRLHVMMLEEQLRKNPILNHCGCFSVRKNSRSIIETLEYCQQILKSPENMVLVFPQGEIQSLYVEHIAFQSGIGYLLDRWAKNYQILLNVNLPDYGSGKKPLLNCYFRMMQGKEYKGLKRLEEEFNLFLDECKNLQTTSL